MKTRQTYEFTKIPILKFFNGVVIFKFPSCIQYSNKYKAYEKIAFSLNVLKIYSSN